MKLIVAVVVLCRALRVVARKVNWICTYRYRAYSEDQQIARGQIIDKIY